jgi:hypothetical protein
VQGLEGALQRETERDGAAKHDSGRTTASVTPPVRRGRKLRSITNIRVAMAAVIRKHEAGEIGDNALNARINGLRKLAEVIEGTDHEKRLAALEDTKAPGNGVEVLHTGRVQPLC